MKLNCLLLYFIVLCSSLCLAQAPGKLHSLHALSTRADFDLVKGEPLSTNFNGIECVKVVYEIKSKTIYYLESKKYKWHYRFVSEVLNDGDNLETFNLYNYSDSPNRRYILATFNYNTNSKNYFLQFASSDNISDELIKVLTAKIEETTFCKSKFKILLNTSILLRRKETISKNHATITSGELFLSQTYQPIVEGKASGILLCIDADSLKKGKDYSQNILMLNGSSNELPICKAVVTNEFQTPLSHICLLTANRNTPCAAQKNSSTLDSLRQFNGKPVEISITKNRLFLKAIDNYSATISQATKKVSPKLDTLRTKIISLNKLGYKDRSAYGSKVCNLAEIKKTERLEQVKVTPPKAFAIPFHYYYRHVLSHGIQQDIQLLIHSTDLNDSIISKRLKQIRKKITTAPLDTGILNTVTRICRNAFPKKTMRFRSSSNAEDEANFNGAGLYKSTSAVYGDSIKTIERAIKQVWASLWNDRAFFERNYFNIDNSKVAMGILVHETYDNELVNGVCITKNLYRNYDFGFVINMQQGENEVVSPKNNMVCEQVVSYMNSTADFYNDAEAAEWISYSSLSPGSSLLTANELKDLTQTLEKIKRHFFELLNVWSTIFYKDFAMDVEFKIILENKQRKLIIKQARPYYSKSVTK